MTSRSSWDPELPLIARCVSCDSLLSPRFAANMGRTCSQCRRDTRRSIDAEQHSNIEDRARRLASGAEWA